jgi:cyclic lactone autoinducer peptide
MIDLSIISSDDKDCYCYSVQGLLEKMEKKKLERTILKGVERISRKEAMSCKASPVPPWPDCMIFLHQPKRPKK